MWQVVFTVNSKVPAAGELLYGVLLELGIPYENIVEKLDRGRCAIEVFESTRRKAEKIVARVKATQLKGVRIALKEIKKADWQDLWKKGIKPFSLTSDIEIIPAWVGGRRRLRPGR